MARSRLVLVGVLAAYLAYLAARSIGAHMYQDTPIMLYAAFLIDRLHLVPYRDFFDMNVPGTYALNILIGRLSGYTDAGVRWVDLGSLTMLAIVTYYAMRRFGRDVAAFGALFFAVLYLASGEWLTLQREYLLLLPIGTAIVLAGTTRLGPASTAIGVGVLVGTAALIKPTMALTLPVFVLSLHGRARDVVSSRPRGLWAVTALTAAGFACPLALATGYLAAAGALASFVDIATGYWPLYDALSGSPRPHLVLSGFDRWSYIARHAFAFGPHPGLPLAAAGTIGAFGALRDPNRSGDDRRVVWLLIALAACCWIHVAIGGKFWVYGWLPFNYVATLLGSLALVDRAPWSRRLRLRAAGVLVLMGIGLPWPYGPFVGRFQFPFVDVEAIATYLQTHAQPGDTVAPLDWTEGAVHAMLLAKATPATPFLYDFHFYHHVSSPYTQHLRRRFMASLNHMPPRFIIRVDQPGRFAGPDTSEDFAELSGFIAAHYRRAAGGPSYDILERQ